MNHSIYSADRSTHLKIVVVALVAGIAVAAFGISARTIDRWRADPESGIVAADRSVGQATHCHQLRRRRS